MVKATPLRRQKAAGCVADRDSTHSDRRVTPLQNATATFKGEARRSPQVLVLRHSPQVQETRARQRWLALNRPRLEQSEPL